MTKGLSFNEEFCFITEVPLPPPLLSEWKVLKAETGNFSFRIHQGAPRGLRLPGPFSSLLVKFWRTSFVMFSACSEKQPSELGTFYSDRRVRGVLREYRITYWNSVSKVLHPIQIRIKLNRFEPPSCHGVSSKRCSSLIRRQSQDVFDFSTWSLLRPVKVSTMPKVFLATPDAGAPKKTRIRSFYSPFMHFFNLSDFKFLRFVWEIEIQNRVGQSFSSSNIWSTCNVVTFLTGSRDVRMIFVIFVEVSKIFKVDNSLFAEMSKVINFRTFPSWFSKGKVP